MNKSVFAIAVWVIALSLVPTGAKAEKVGVAAAVQNSVMRVTGGGTQPLSTGSDVFTNERIRTGESSVAQILFLDKTTLTVGPRAEVTLDRFVYNSSSGNGRVVLNAVRGAFRFVTGSQKPSSYTVRTPVGVLGVRGTIVDLVVDPVTRQALLVLVEGILTFTFNGQTYTLDKPGWEYVFSADGTVTGPRQVLGDPTQAVYQRYYDASSNSPTGTYLQDIDQIGGIIQRGIPAPAAPSYPGNN